MKEDPAIMTKESWDNLRAQLKVMIDIYCEMNEEMFGIKKLLGAIVKYIVKKEKGKKRKAKKR